MSILRRAVRLAYHATRSKVDRHHRIKYSREFCETMALVDQSKLSEDRLADYILAWSKCDHLDEQQVTEVAKQLAYYGLDEEIIDLLPGVFTLSARGLCEPTVAADALASVALSFGIDPTETRQADKSISHIITRTPLTVSEAASILQVVGPRARMANRELWDVTTDIVGTYRGLPDPKHLDETVARTIREELIQQYDAERRAL